MKHFLKYCAAFTVFFSTASSISTVFSAEEEMGEESDEIQLEGDPLLTRQFIEEAEKEEDESRKKLISYGTDVPSVISWCVNEDLKTQHGCKDIQVLSVVRGGGNWALATSKAQGVLYYTAMEKPRDNIRILGSSKQVEAAVDLIPDASGKTALMQSLSRLQEQGLNLTHFDGGEIPEN